MNELLKNKSNRELNKMKSELEKESNSIILNLNQAVDNRIQIAYRILQIDDEMIRRNEEEETN